MDAKRALLTPPIEGVFLTPLRVIPAEGGPVLHLLRPDTLAPAEAREVYFSEIGPGCVKAWKRHERMTQRLAVPMGEVLFGLYDDRPASPTRGQSSSLALGRPGNWFLLHIPPRVWYGFKGLGNTASLVVNCPDCVHDPDESVRLPADAPGMPALWG